MYKLKYTIEANTNKTAFRIRVTRLDWKPSKIEEDRHVTADSLLSYWIGGNVTFIDDFYLWSYLFRQLSGPGSGSQHGETVVASSYFEALALAQEHAKQYKDWQWSEFPDPKDTKNVKGNRNKRSKKR